jgi:hypothetical protein
LGPALDSAVRKLKIGNLKVQLERCWTLCESLVGELNNSELTSEEQAASLSRCDDLRKESYTLQLALELLERQEREEDERGAATQH